MLSAIMISVIMLNAVMLNVIMPSVVAPFDRVYHCVLFVIIAGSVSAIQIQNIGLR